MNLLSEKILKTQKAIKTFQDFLSDDEKVKNNSYSKEIALHWKEIEKFLEDSKIVLVNPLSFVVWEKLQPF